MFCGWKMIEFSLLAGAGTSCPTPARWTMDSLDTYDLLWTRLLSNKIRRPLFCFPFKDRLHPKSFGAAISFLQHQMFRRVWLDEVFSSSFKTICCKKFFWKETFIIKLSWTTFFGLNFLDGGSTFKHVFPDFRTNRIRKTGCFHLGRILGPRGAQRHLKHEDRSSGSANSYLTLLLF